jgi:hypothetical protein
VIRRALHPPKSEAGIDFYLGYSRLSRVVRVASLHYSPRSMRLFPQSERGNPGCNGLQLRSGFRDQKSIGGA